MDKASYTHTNRLIHETSPYLLQHAHNPVDWYPWGPEALARAKAENKPILLSVGYSACHWCHVMERESFEDEDIARLMNELYINIKVDREERPDIDDLYMQAVQAFTGNGGWPMTVFLTPEGLPFYGGTYFPPTPRLGMPGFANILVRVAEYYHQHPDKVEETAQSFREFFARGTPLQPQEPHPQPSLHFVEPGPESETLDRAARELASAIDRVYGGLSRAPKFPQPMALEYLLLAHLRQKSRDRALALQGPEAIPGIHVQGTERRPGSEAQPSYLSLLELTLDHMANGGIYDQLGGGFHRYATDARWLVPHFEKMLYDNALLSRLYLHAFQITGKPLYRRIVTETLDYVQREMLSPEGGFYSTQDADSEGEEGKFFLWTPDEVIGLLGEKDGMLFCRYYDVTSRGNFEGQNILHVDADVATVAEQTGVSPERLTEVLARGREILFAAREQRVKPGRDEKILTAWNGLMLRSFAEAARVLERDDYRAIAERNARFLLEYLVGMSSARAGAGRRAGDTGPEEPGHGTRGSIVDWSPLLQGGRVLRTYKDGQAKLLGYLEDYANLAVGLLALYETTFELHWFAAARALADAMLDLFWDEAGGGFFDTGRDHEQLIGRPKNLMDNATPAGNSVATEVLLRLAAYTGEARYHECAAAILDALAPTMVQYPAGFGHLLLALDLAVTKIQEVAIIGAPDAPDTRALLATIAERYRPWLVLALAVPGAITAAQTIPLLADRPPVAGKATAYVCEGFVCRAPVTDPAALHDQLR
jgi:uncharacterized protein YyaL (SSP411 family)